MMGSWWFLWMMLMFAFVLPLGYGWGYRGWGPPYPRYMQRRRAQRAATLGGPGMFNHTSWGIGGDVVWMLLLVAIFWGGAIFWWH